MTLFGESNHIGGQKGRMDQFLIHLNCNFQIKMESMKNLMGFLNAVIAEKESLKKTAPLMVIIFSVQELATMRLLFSRLL